MLGHLLAAGFDPLQIDIVTDHNCKWALFQSWTTCHPRNSRQQSVSTTNFESTGLRIRHLCCTQQTWVNGSLTHKPSKPCQLVMTRTSTVPLWDLYSTSTGLLQYLYGTSRVPLRDLYCTSNLQDLYYTSAYSCLPEYHSSVCCCHSHRQVWVSSVPGTLWSSDLVKPSCHQILLKGGGRALNDDMTGDRQLTWQVTMTNWFLNYIRFSEYQPAY